MTPTTIHVDMAQKFSSTPIWKVIGPDGVTTMTNSFTVEGTVTLKQSVDSSGIPNGYGAWLETNDTVTLTSDTIPLLDEQSLDPTTFGYPISRLPEHGGWQFPYHLMNYTAIERIVRNPKLTIVTPCRQLLVANKPACVAYTKHTVQVGKVVTLTGTVNGIYINPAVVEPVTCWIETDGTVVVS
jgi:hypothetical protein